jgi:hypothetical protein
LRTGQAPEITQSRHKPEHSRRLTIASRRPSIYRLNWPWQEQFRKKAVPFDPSPKNICCNK